MMLNEAIRLIITGNSAGAVKALEQTATAAGATEAVVSSRLTKMNAVASKLVIPFVALAAIIGKSVKDYVSFGVLVAKVSNQTGMGAEATSRFVGQLQFFHADASKAGMAVKTLENQIYGLETGASASVATFKILGLTWEDLKNLKPEDQLTLIRDRLSQIPDPAARSAAAAKLLGRGAKDFALWYGASADAVDRVNKELDRNHQILSKAQLDDIEKAGTAWKDFTGSLKGFEYALGRAALPSLTLLSKVLTVVVRALQPFAKYLVPLTGFIGAFILVIKTAVFFQKTWNQLLGLFPARAAAAAAATEGMTLAEVGTTGSAAAAAGATGVFTTALGGLALAAGVALAALAALVAIYEVVKVASQAFAATRQEAEQYKGAMANYESGPAMQKITAWQKAHPGKPLPADLQQLLDLIKKNAMADTKSHIDVASWATGTDHVTNGPELFVAGEGGQRERVRVTPLGKEAPSLAFDFRGAHFSAHTPTEIAESVMDIVGKRVAGLGVAGT